MHVSALWEEAGTQSAQKQHRRVAVDLICGWSLSKVDVRDTKYLHNGTVLLKIFSAVLNFIFRLHDIGPDRSRPVPARED